MLNCDAHPMLAREMKEALHLDPQTYPHYLIQGDFPRELTEDPEDLTEAEMHYFANKPNTEKVLYRGITTQHPPAFHRAELIATSARHNLIINKFNIPYEELPAAPIRPLGFPLSAILNASPAKYASP